MGFKYFRIAHKEETDPSARFRRRISGGYPAYETRPGGFENPVRKVGRWKRNIISCYQRIRYGFCLRDVWCIDGWFLRVMPYMIQTLRSDLHGFPDEVVKEVGDQEFSDYEGKDDACMKRWCEILSEIEHYLFEACDETCSRKNPYKSEMEKADREFSGKHGIFGEKLRTPDEIKRDKEKGCHTVHMPHELPEYKQVTEKYMNACREIADYQEECCKKGLNLFVKWFHHLCD